MILARRGFLLGLSAGISAPMICRVESLMRVVPIDVWDTRCLIDYCINMDEYVLRVDRRLETMIRPPKIMQVSIAQARQIFGSHDIFDMRPEAGKQVYADARVGGEIAWKVLKAKG